MPHLRDEGKRGGVGKGELQRALIRRKFHQHYHMSSASLLEASPLMSWGCRSSPGSFGSQDKTWVQNTCSRVQGPGTTQGPSEHRSEDRKAGEPPLLAGGEDNTGALASKGMKVRQPDSPGEQSKTRAGRSCLCSHQRRKECRGEKSNE